MTPLQIEAATSRWWRLGVAVLAALSIGSVTTWWWLMPVESAALAGATGLAAIVIALALVASLRRVGTTRLEFDGVSWSLVQRGRREPLPGTVRVMIDMGEFILLRFDAAVPSRPVWVPVDSTDPACPWHALRAAVYGAPHASLRPAAE